ncbi:MAG: DUF1292 domain-containing protein [Lachnospiraceae bacterium]|nr:DUF1292 domain-containing protein [Lachnospiraceae bacterium]MBR2755535.1 DUF1292 domain-containing protein [Lachnospiraceae bacterium]MBR2841920.1 DUF1292 domain-containing protein [Lachnospiraceae bacterium]MBR3263074.1 DUF1292 domain-containing protein [Lachnospiraceae bacterium]MBR3361691.1 DUF1292 domain-containing protein [Lachnospiraceae bacterium]
MEDNKIIITGEDGETKEFFVEEETRLNNTSYLLVCDSMDEETQAYIMKDVSAPEDIESIYEFVVDDAELNAVAGIFSELLEDEDLI